MFGLLPNFPYVFKHRDRETGRFVKAVDALPPKVYGSHRAYAGNMPIGEGVPASALAAVNPFVHHCRIGKITLKQA